jgi:hypothetical protein
MMPHTLPQELHGVTRADMKALKARYRKAKDPISREWYGALLEGMKPSPWYYDNNVPSLYRSRYMAVIVVAVVAIHLGHELAEEGLQFLRGTRRNLPNTFATLPAIVREWEAGWSARIDAQILGDYELRQPAEGAELDGLNAWVAGILSGVGK